jgi:hypothetical protein
MSDIDRCALVSDIGLNVAWNLTSTSAVSDVAAHVTDSLRLCGGHLLLCHHGRLQPDANYEASPAAGFKS